MSDRLRSAMRLSRNASLAILVVVALLLVWRVVVSGTTAFVAGSARRRSGIAPGRRSSSTRRTRHGERASRAIRPITRRSCILALQLERQGKMAEASGAMREALRLAPADEQTLLEAAAFHLRTGDEPQGLAILRRAVELNPTAGNAAWPALSRGAQQRAGTTHSSPAAARDNPAWWPAFFDHACRAATDLDAGAARVRRARGLGQR